VALDEVHAIVPRPWSADVFGGLRSFCEDFSEPWPRLRIIVGMSTAPALGAHDVNQSPFGNVSSQIRLTDLTEANVQRLAALHRLALAARDRAELERLVGGHPFLVRLAMYHAAKRSRALVDVLQRDHDVFEPFLDSLRSRLMKDRSLLDVARWLSFDRPIS